VIEERYDVAVVGAGPAGSTAARAAAEKGASVLLLEKDRDVGYPVRCGEGVRRKELEERVEVDEKWIAASVTKFSLTGPKNKEITMELGPKWEYLILHRRLFDYDLARFAAEAGATVRTSAYVDGVLREDGVVTGVTYEYRGERRAVRASAVIGADGVESRVGRWAGIQTAAEPRLMGCCAQATVANVDIDPSIAAFYHGKSYAPLGYLWVFPKGDRTANIGVGVSGSKEATRSAREWLDLFLRERHPNASILTEVAGGCPSANGLERYSVPGLMLVGDAGRHVNPLTGAGIPSGMTSGEIAGEIAATMARKSDPDLALEFDARYRRKIGWRHDGYEKVRDKFYSASEERLEELFDLFLEVPPEKRTLRRVVQHALAKHPNWWKLVLKIFFK
jgi:digeranylgeranylglycerophospholipid reductase